MKTVLVDKEKCVDCGNCEPFLPGLIHKLNGVLPISDINYERKKDTIERAISQCYLDCIIVIHDMVYMYKCSKCKRTSNTHGNGAPAAYCSECQEQSLKRIA